jgi:hypothetical protein
MKFLKIITRSLITPVLILGSFLIFNTVEAAPCKSPAWCTDLAICTNSANKGTQIAGDCASGKICCQAAGALPCASVSVKSTPCEDKPGLVEVPEAAGAACPGSASFTECSSKPKTGTGNVLCCYDLTVSSSGGECVPKTVQADKMYLCMTSAACANVSGKEVATKKIPSECKASGGQIEVCCETPTRTGVTTNAPTAAAPSSYKLQNPLGQVDLRIIAQNVINTFLGVVGAIALIVFVYAGVTYMIAAGSDRLKKAQDTMKYAVLGIALIMFSFVITDTFLSVWLVNLPSNTPPEINRGTEAPTEAQQDVADLKSQQQNAAKAQADAEAKAKAEASKSGTDICGTTGATTGYSCTTLSSTKKRGTKSGEYTCVSGYCMTQPKNSNYSCCKVNP